MLDSLTLEVDIEQASDYAHNIGVVFDTTMMLEKHAHKCTG